MAINDKEVIEASTHGVRINHLRITSYNVCYTKLLRNAKDAKKYGIVDHVKGTMPKILKG